MGIFVKAIYEEYKRRRYKYVEPSRDRSVQTQAEKLPARSRILFSKNGIEKLCSIDKSIARYGRYTAKELVDLYSRSKRFAIVSPASGGGDK